MRPTKKIIFFPGDIDIVMAIGDSLTSATVCILNWFFFGTQKKTISIFLVCKFSCTMGGVN